MSKKDAAIHKRQQIEQSSRVMFLWVAGASVIVGFALVISWFLVQQIIFKERVLGEKITLLLYSRTTTTQSKSYAAS